MAVNVPRHKEAFGELIIRDIRPHVGTTGRGTISRRGVGGGRYRILRRLDARRCLSTTACNQPFGGRDGLVGIATRYWMDVPGIEHSTSCTTSTGSSPGEGVRVKRPERGNDHPLTPSTEVRNECNYTSTPPVCLPWQVTGRPLPLHQST